MAIHEQVCTQIVTITIHYIINSDRSENQKRERTVRKRN